VYEAAGIPFPAPGMKLGGPDRANSLHQVTLEDKSFLVLFFKKEPFSHLPHIRTA
jgi:hypothetical protein